MLRTLRTWLAERLATDIPPHSYALLRITLGVVGIVSLLGLTPLEMYWPLDSLSPLPGEGSDLRAWLYEGGLGTVAGYALYVGLVAAFGAMTVGYRSDVAVLLCFVGQVAQTHWNNLPLSSAHQVMTVLLFCLLWANTGEVWSLDARGRQRRAEAREPAWPLWLMQCQVALIYLSSGLHKLAYPMWRDGTAVHWALNLNSFHRFPWPAPAAWAPLEALFTWGTLLFELSFWLLVIFRRTRPIAIVAGIGLHLGLFATLELGPFSFLMVASYICFVDPGRVARLFRAAPEVKARAEGTKVQPQ
jgi:hypothetical protein